MSPPGIIRAATADDALAIARVHCRAWRETYTGILPDVMVEGLTESEARTSWTAKLADPDFQVFAAEMAGAIVGFASARPSNEPEADFDGLLDTLYIEHAGQGEGLGRQLTRAVAENLHQRGFAAMGVVVHADNPALGFYEAVGGRPILERTRLHRGHMCPEVLLSWPLPLTWRS